MLPVVTNPKVPGEFRSLDPLTGHQRRTCIILFVIFNMAYHCPQVCSSDGLSDFILVKCLSPLQDVYGNLIACILETKGLGPLFPARCNPVFTKLPSTVTGERGFKWMVRTPPIDVPVLMAIY